MVLGTNKRFDFPAMVDRKRGLVERSMFSDPDIYQAELEQIFARAWNFMAHESQLSNAGDFFLNDIGEDRVIVVRDKDGDVQVLLNTCRHRGNAVCRADEGHATSFMCTYHGWTYDLRGKLVGVPGFKDYYHEDLNRDEWGLVAAPHVDSYLGFIFATLDPEAVPLQEFLGDVGRMGIHQIVARGLTRVVGGIEKWTIDCNWKFAADNVWDYYHGGLTHASAMMAGWQGGRRTPQVAPPPRPSGGKMPQLIVLGEYGHAQGGPMATEETQRTGNPLDVAFRDRPEAKQILGPVGIRA